MKNKKLIIFDMDGTLIDSGDVITNTINFVRDNLGLKKIPKKEMLSQLNNPDINSSEYFYGTKSFTDEQTELFTQYYNENCIKDINLYSGIKELLESLQSNYRLSIATNASRDFAVKMCQHLDIDHHFDLIVGASCVQNPKPSPDMLIKTLQELDIDHKHSILVGDSHKDIRAADAAQMDSILVNWGFSQYEEKNTVTTTEQLHFQLQNMR